MPCIDIERTTGAPAAPSSAARAVAALALAVARLHRAGRIAVRAKAATTRRARRRPRAAGAGRRRRRAGGAKRGARCRAPKAGRNWTEVRQQAAERLVAANPDITYLGRVPDQLLAIPVLEIELNGDGSVRRIEILREPRQAKDTLKIAVDAVRRAAPFGDVSRLPKPWKFVETFLFDDDRKFKPRTLDR